MDPLAERRSWLSTYNYVQNNPLGRIDPFGLTDYEINGKGKISKVENTDTEDGTDRLIRGKARYKNGELKNSQKDVLEVKKGTFGEENDTWEQSEEKQVFWTDSGDESEKLFNFIADYVDTEMGKFDVSDKNGNAKSIFYTEYDPENLGNSNHYIFRNKEEGNIVSLFKHSHNHPNNIAENKIGTLKPSDGDKLTVSTLNLIFKNTTYHIRANGRDGEYNENGRIK